MMFTPSVQQIVNASPESNVYYQEDDDYIHVYHPNFYVKIAKSRDNELPGGRIDALNFKGKSLVNSNEPQFGSISLINALDTTQIQQMLPDDVFLVSVFGNDTNKLVLTIETASISLFDETEPLPVDVTVEFTFYADIDNIYVWVTLDSTITAWRLDSTLYGSSLGLLYFQNYEVKGTRNTLLGQGSLTGNTNNDIKFRATTAQITVKNTSNNLAVTMFPLGLFPYYAVVGDRESSTWIYLKTIGPSTYDGSWYAYGQNIRNITYGTGIALHEPDTLPQVVTPWLMPNAVPYGIMQSIDELPADTYT